MIGNDRGGSHWSEAQAVLHLSTGGAANFCPCKVDTGSQNSTGTRNRHSTATPG